MLGRSLGVGRRSHDIVTRHVCQTSSRVVESLESGASRAARLEQIESFTLSWAFDTEIGLCLLFRRDGKQLPIPCLTDVILLCRYAG